MSVFRFLLAAMLAITASGCATRVAVVSNEKSAYVVRADGLTSSMYHCNAESGKPVCTEVAESE